MINHQLANMTRAKVSAMLNPHPIKPTVFKLRVGKREPVEVTRGQVAMILRTARVTGNYATRLLGGSVVARFTDDWLITPLH